MRIYCEKDYNAMSRRAANIISAEVIRHPDCVLGLATGSTPVGTYRQLIEWNQKSDVSFKEVRTVNLDEYKGLSADHNQSYRYFMNKNLFDCIDIIPENTYIPDGQASDPEEECRRYDKLVEALGYPDLQLLGLGHNGHIGFNEPDNCFIKETHVVNLTESTIEANARFFSSADEVPRQALTMGIGCVMKSHSILLAASGADKAEALYKAICGPITPQCPASILQLHPEVIIVCDEAAFSILKERKGNLCG